MIKILFTILIFFITQNFTFCYSATPIKILSNVEENFYGFSYNNENIENRLERIENFVYGKSKKGDVNKRINQLNIDIAADVYGKEITPTKDTFLTENNLKEDNSVNYPIVNDIENKLFNKTYRNRDFHSRIVTIEKKLFGKIYDIDDYSTRMDRIKNEVYPNTIANSEKFDNEYRDNRIDSKTLSALNSNKFSMPYGQEKFTRPYTNYGEYSEFHNFNKNDSINNNSSNLDDELAKLEYETFGTNFSNDDTTKRIKRLNSVNKAQKNSSKYDDNKFSQRMSTAMEIGAMILMILAMVL